MVISVYRLMEYYLYRYCIVVLSIPLKVLLQYYVHYHKLCSHHRLYPHITTYIIFSSL